jgi:hypothetical protein
LGRDLDKLEGKAKVDAYFISRSAKELWRSPKILVCLIQFGVSWQRRKFRRAMPSSCAPLALSGEGQLLTTFLPLSLEQHRNGKAATGEAHPISHQHLQFYFP